MFCLLSFKILAPFISLFPFRSRFRYQLERSHPRVLSEEINNWKCHKVLIQIRNPEVDTDLPSRSSSEVIMAEVGPLLGVRPKVHLVCPRSIIFLNIHVEFFHSTRRSHYLSRRLQPEFGSRSIFLLEIIHELLLLTWLSNLRLLSWSINENVNERKLC